MSTITVYSFTDENGEEHGVFNTQDAREAEDYARRESLNVVANEYEWTEAVHVEAWQFAKAKGE